MANLKQEFIEYLKFHVNKSIYVWGGQGQDLKTLTENKIRNMETSTVNANRAIALLNKRKNIEGAKAFDCSGLGTYFFGNIKGMCGDMTANDMKNTLCTPITRSALKAGDFVFKCYSNGKAYHIGYVVDDKLNVVEAKGRLYGVIKDKLSAGGWTRYGRPKFYEDDTKETTTKKESTKKSTGGKCTVTTTVIKKGVKGEATRAMQILLIGRGFSCGKYGADASCGNDTVKAIKAFQEAVGLTATGNCGTKTWDKLING